MSLIALVLLSGSKRIPELGDAPGKDIRAFKNASDRAFEEDLALPHVPERRPSSGSSTRPSQ